MGKSIDSLISVQIKPNEPGISVLVAEKGKIAYEKAFGSANLELSVPLQPDMVFRIGSITKQFTAVAILQFVEQGKISLRDSVQKYIQDFPSKGYKITIQNLLTHTSGITDYSSMNDPDPYIERRDFTPKFIIDYFKKEPLQFEPGTKYGYSNSNYVLLGYIIEMVTGKSYHDYMRENIIKPAGLANTYFASEMTIVPKRVAGYTRDNGFFQNCDYQSISMGYACGDLMSTVEDLFKWNKAVLELKLIKKENVEQAFTPGKLNNGSHSNYGYGWFIDSLHGSVCIHHEGQVSGFIGEEKYFPKEDIYISILTNLKSSEDKTDFSNTRFRFFEKISSIALGEKLPNELNVDAAILDSYIGIYQMISKPKNTLRIYKKGGQLYADLSNGTGKNMLLVAQSDTQFYLPDIIRIHTTFEFIKENGKVVKLIAIQEKKYEWKKIE